MDKMRWRYGDMNPVVAAVDVKTVIEIGDLIWQDVCLAKPASELPAEIIAMGLGFGQQAFARQFLGVAMQRSPLGEDTPIRVATTGVFELDAPKGRIYELGGWVGACGHDGVPGLCNQRVMAVPASSLAIGRVARRDGCCSGSVMIDIRSTVMTGGVEGTTAGRA